MIVQNYKQSEIDGDDFEGVDASIDESNLGFLFDIVSKQMYRRPINSIVREITSNCFDSHIEAKIDDPVVVIMKHDEGGDYICFKDIGVGMSPERMSKTYSKYFSSTKRGSNDQIGMFGLGSKSPLSYTDLFYLTTNYNGKKYEYQIHNGKKTPRIDLLIEDDTDERNGTEVKIYIKNTADVSSFVSACKSELIYFDNVYFNSYYKFNNEYNILEYKTFKYRDDTKYSNQLHLIIGKVPYPISWDEIGLSPINIPCGLKFEIGDLQVTPERESIRYVDVIKEDGTTESTKEIILKKIQDFKEEIESLHDKNIDNIFDYYPDYLRYEQDNRCYVTLDENIRLDVSSLIKKPKGIFSPLQDFVGKIPTNLFYEYSYTQRYVRNKKVANSHANLNYNNLETSFTLSPPKSGKFNTKKLAYLYDKAFDLTDAHTFYLFDHSSNRNLRQTLNYLEIPIESSKYDYSKTNATQQLKLFRDYVSKEIKRLTYNADDIHIDEDWLKKYNLANKVKVNKEENSFLVYNYGGHTLAEKEYITVDQLQKFTGFIIYGFEENEDLIRNFRNLLINSKYGSSTNTINSKMCRLYKIAERNQKYFIGVIKNASHIETFMGNNRIFKRFATTAWIQEESKALSLKGYRTSQEGDFVTVMENIFPPVSQTLKDLEAACDDYGKTAYTSVDNKLSKEFFKDMVNVAKEYNLYDKEMYDAHLKLERYVKGLDLINYIVCKEEVIPYLVEYLKLKGKKVDSIWNSQEQYELDLIKESLEKMIYLCSVYEDKRFLGKGDSFYDHKSNRRTSKNSKTNDIKVKHLSQITKITKQFQGLLNYKQYVAN
jgi:hypothetical protein